MSIVSEVQDNEYEWNVGFGDTNYVVMLIIKGAVLNLEIEEAVSGERWSGEFTAQYVEEITLKAGNFKKFSVFVKMLISSFDRENDSIYVDVLTYADLEALKARKAGSQESSSSSETAAMQAGTAKSKSQMKRYVILTYRSEFDRVHYPLPLSHEDGPNPESLRRTIRRLRGVIEAHNKEGRPAEFVGEKDLRAMVANLRQENQELRHRMRQAESRSVKATMNNTGLVGTASTSHGELVAKANAELVAQNGKLKKQLEACKRELAAADVNFEEMRTSAAKELSKWKQRALDGTAGKDVTTIASAPSGASVSSAGSARLDKYSLDSAVNQQSENDALRRRIHALERELKLERINSAAASSQARAQATRSGSNSNKRPSPGPVRTRSATPPPARASGVWSPASGSRSGTGSAVPPRHASRSPASSAYQTRHTRLDPFNDPHAKENRLKAAAAAARIRERKAALEGGANAVSSGRSGSNGRGSRDVTPRGRAGSAEPERSRSPALPSSSTGGRFDPTAYQRAKEQRQAQTLASKSGSFRNSVGQESPADRRRRESYDSSDSRGSGHRSDSRPGSAQRKNVAVRRSSPRANAATQEIPSAPARKQSRRSKRSGISGSNRPNAEADISASRGILSGSDTEDEHLRMRAVSASAQAPRNTGVPFNVSGARGIAEGNIHDKESVVNKVVGAFPFPLADGGSDGEQVQPSPVMRSAQSAVNTSSGTRRELAASPTKRSAPERVNSPRKETANAKVEESGSVSPTVRRSLEGKSRDGRVEQVLPASNVSFSHVQSSGYGSLDGYADAAKSIKQRGTETSENKSPRSPAKSPLASPSRTPRSSREGLSVSFSEFRKTPGGDDEIQEIDKRIQALQSYLDNARTGLLASTNKL